VSARTISIDTPAAMGAAARAIADAQLIKIKLDGNDPDARLRAVRANAPDAALIVDANEGWSLDLLRAMQDVLIECGVKLVEQPLPAGHDAALSGFVSQVPLCADESCHVAADVPTLCRRYGFVNIKLDKTGGLTEALALLTAARAAGMGVMVGCMLGTSLGMAPAMRVAALADYADLDGPWWLRADHPGGLRFAADGSIGAPDDTLWTWRPDA
jgi:L-alanine-DL-glutamate epimerase-like enolase superfamily enzyme